MATEPYPDRWTHHVLIPEQSEIDDELMEWIRGPVSFLPENGDVRLQFVDRICDRHVPNSLCRGVDRCGAGNRDDQQYDCDGRDRDLPCSAKVSDDQSFIEQIVEQQSEDASDDTAADSVCERFGGDHPCDLPAFHTDGAHGSVLLDSGGHAHGNAVHNI